MSRPRKPNEIHKLVGGFRDDRHGDSMEAPATDAVIPRWVRDSTREQWNEITDLLRGLGMLSDAYTPGMALLADALADLVRYSKIADVTDPVIPTDKGNLIQHPIFSLKNAAWLRVIKAAREFGLTPSAITTVKAAKNESKTTLPRLRIAK